MVSNETTGLNSLDMDPNPFPSELPQGMDNPLKAEFVRPALEQQQQEQGELDQWARTSLDSIHKEVLAIDQDSDAKSQRAKKRQIIRDLMDVKMDRRPESSFDYGVARGVFAEKYFDGSGRDDDDALFEQIRKESEVRKKSEETLTSLRDSAYLGTLGGEGFDKWAEGQGEMSEPRKNSLLASWKRHEDDVMEAFGDVAPHVKRTFRMFQQGDVETAMDYADMVITNMDDVQDEELFMAGLREVVLANPSKQVHEFLNEIGVNPLAVKGMQLVGNIDKARQTVPETMESGVVGGVDLFHKVMNADIWRYGAMGITEDDLKKKRDIYDEVRKSNDVRARIKRVFSNDFDPIKPLMPEGSSLRAIEEGVYAIPSAATTSLMAAVPYVGLAATTGTIYEFGRQNYMQELLATGMDMDRAGELAGTMAMVAAVPNVMLEKWQSFGWKGRLPGLDKIFSKVNNTVRNRAARVTMNTMIANTGEAVTELAQDAVESLVQDYGHAFSEEIPDVEWYNGQDGVFDGYFNKFLTAFTAVAPLGVSTAIGGVSADRRAEAFRALPPVVRKMYGVTQHDSDAIDNAQNPQELLEAVQRAEQNRDPNSDEAIDEVHQYAEELERKKEVMRELQRMKEMPIFRTSKESEGVVELIHPETGVVLETVQGSSAAAEAAFSYLEMQDNITQERFDELAWIIEGAILDVEEAADPKAKAELRPGQKKDVAAILSEFPEYAERAMSQSDRLDKLVAKEQLNGGTGAMSRLVWAMSEPEHEADQTSYIQRLFSGSTALTLVHERGHVKFRQALDSGAITLDETFNFFSKLDTALEGKTDRNGQQLRFLPEGTEANDFRALDEAVAEFMEVMILKTQNGKKTRMRDIVGRQLSALVKANVPGATKFKAFYDAMMEFFTQALSRHFFIKKAIRDGVISESEIDAFRAKLQGTTEQEQFDADVAREAAEMAGEAPFSMGRNLVTRKSAEQASQEMIDKIGEDALRLEQPSIPLNEKRKDIEQLTLSLSYEHPGERGGDAAESRKGGDERPAGSPFGTHPISDRTFSGIRENLRVDFAGEKIEDLSELADKLQVLRNPRFETFYLIGLNDEGVILDSLAITSRIPYSSSIFEFGESYKSHSDFLRAAGATRYVMAHNHPTGDTTPSVQDRVITKQHAAIMAEGKFKFDGHIVINHGKYSALNEHGVVIVDGEAVERIERAQGKKPKPSTIQEHLTGGEFMTQITSSGKMASVLKEAYDYTQKSEVMVAFLDRKNVIASIYPSSLDSVRSLSGKQIQEFAADRGLASMVLHMPNVGELEAVKTLRKMLEAGIPLFEILFMGPEGQLVSLRDYKPDLFLPEPYLWEAGRSWPAVRVQEGAGEDVQRGASFSIAPAFYSKLEGVLEEKIQGKQATAEQIMGMVDPSKGSGVKAEEIKWTGLQTKIDELAAENNGMVPKAELMEWIKNDGKVKLKEVVMGEPDARTEDQIYSGWIHAHVDLYNNHFDDVGEDIHYEYDDRGDYGYFYETSEGNTEVVHEGSPSEIARALNIEENPMGDDADESDTKYQEYTIPGGENYKETVLRMPVEMKMVPKGVLRTVVLDNGDWRTEFLDGSYQNLSGRLANTKEEAEAIIVASPDGYKFEGGSKYRSPHFSDVQGYIAHMRTNERPDSTGGEGLFIEEIQSDLHQAARRYGYKGDSVGPPVTEMEFVTPGELFVYQTKNQYFVRPYNTDREAELDGIGDGFKGELGVGKGVVPSEDAARGYYMDWANRQIEKVNSQRRSNAASFPAMQSPDAPFRKDWGIQMFKRALADAVMAGKDWIGWTNGETQNERYDLSKQVDSIIAGLRPRDGLYQIEVLKDGEMIADKQIAKDDLADFLGKDLAKKIIESEDVKNGIMTSYSGLDLKVGGHGMKGFYDNILPKDVGKYVKQWGAKVEDGAVEKDTPIHKVVINDTMRDSIERVGQPSFSISPAQDAEYLAAVEAGDTEAAQAMVDAAAKAAGYDSPKVYHVTRKGTEWDSFDRNKKSHGYGFFFATSEDKAIKAAKQKGRVITAYLKTTNIEGSEKSPWGTWMDLAFGKGADMDTSIRSGDSDAVWVKDEGGVSIAVRNPNQIKSADPVTYDSDGNVIPLSQRFDTGRDGISFSMGDAYMKDTLINNARKRMRTPQGMMQVMGDISRRVAALKREVPQVKRAFGKDYVQKEVVDPASMRDLKAQAAQLRRDEVQAAENEVYDRYGDILDNKDITRLSSQPITSRILDEGGFESLGAATSRRGDASLFGGEYEAIAGLPPIYYGGTESPDQMALILYNEGLIRENDVEVMMREVDKEITSVARHKDELAAARKIMADARKSAKRNADVWLAERVAEQKRDHNPMARAKRALQTLAAIRMALPIELRGRVGDDVKLLTLNSDEKRLEYLEKTLEKVDEVVEKWLRDEFDESAKKLLQRAEVKRKEPGKTDRGKFWKDYGAQLHNMFIKVDQAMKAGAAEVKGMVEGLRAELEENEQNGTLTPEKENYLESTLSLVELFGDWRNADAAEREAAVITGWRMFEEGYYNSMMAKIRDRERLDGLRAQAAQDTGKLGTAIERDGRTIRENQWQWKDLLTKQGRRDLIDKIFLGLMSFDQFLGWHFGDDSEITRKFVDWERQADYQKNDAMHAHQLALEAKFRDLAGGDPVDGLKLQNKLQTETYKTKTIPRELTLMGIIQARMMWRQEDGRRHMEGRFDDDGKLVSKWGYTQEFMDELDGLMTPEAREVEEFLSESYLSEWEGLNAVHERVWGVTMPRNGMYSPLTVSAYNVNWRDTIDPITQQSMSTMASTPTSLIRRNPKAVAEPRFDDALHVWYAHKNQIEYWKAYVEFNKEYQSVMGNRDVRDSVEAKTGKEGLASIGTWGEVLNLGGIKESSMRIGFMQAIQRGMNRTAQAALAGRLSVLAIQATQAGAAAAHMPAKSYMYRLAKASMGKLNFKEAWSSDYIQRRIRQAPPAVRMAMEQMRKAEPSKANYYAYHLGKKISQTDGFFTSVTYAIIHDYQRTKLGKSNAEAHKEAERLTEQVAQPLRRGTRSLFENTTINPLFKLVWAFSSEPRQKLMLSAYKTFTGRTTAEKLRAWTVTFGFGGAFASLIRAIMADIRDDDDDEIFDDKHWNVARLVAQSLTEPFSGIPVVGDGVQSIGFTGVKAMGFKPGYLPDSNLLQASEKAAKAAVRLADDPFEDFDKTFRDVDILINGVAPFSDTAAAYTSFSHLAKDIYSIGKNALPD